MKAVFAIVMVALLAWLGWALMAPDQETPVAGGAAANPDPPTTTIVDGAAVFRQAFWKRPSANDRILHAERRVWSDEDGVEKWEWFLAVEPSPELVKYLREDNAFSLSPASSPATVIGAPEWFSVRPGEVEVLQSRQGKMQLFFGKTKNFLYATDAGGGFTKGAEAPTPPQVVHTPNPGRLPTTPPPNPQINE
jgi:hypothetical protein